MYYNIKEIIILWRLIERATVINVKEDRKCQVEQ
jgi:hypothetical protein